MLLEIYGINYFLHLTAATVGSHLDVQIVDEAFYETPFAGESGNASEVNELVECYSGMKIIDQQKLEIAEYYRRVQDLKLESKDCIERSTSSSVMITARFVPIMHPRTSPLSGVGVPPV